MSLDAGKAEGRAARRSRAKIARTDRAKARLGSFDSDGLLQGLDAEDAVGEEVVLLGRQGDAEVSAGEVAVWAGTIAYEVLCLLGLRLPRRYRRAGREVAFDTRFTH